MEIQSHFKTYRVDFVETLDEIRTLAERPETFFVVDRAVYDLYRDTLSVIPPARQMLIDAREEQKNMDTVLRICEKMTEMPSKRNTHLVSIGGGITQDVTGFVASSLYRGIRWTFYPSTLLAASDSCIGGKSSLNYKGFKNLLGSFYPPDVIKIYPAFFRTLTPRDYMSGLGEVVKFSVIAGGSSFAQMETDIDAILAHDYDVLQKYLVTSLTFKKRFIEADEFDKGERILLNFAHTFGHAYEVTSSYAIPHGSAVAMGMITANAISVRRGFIEADYAARIEQVCRKILTEIEIQRDCFDMDGILSAIRKDKKQTDAHIRAVLIRHDGELGVFRDVHHEEIADAVTHLMTFMRRE